jgi:peptidoglycan-associated lipoprotein
MKKVSLIGIATALILVTGCSQKSPEIDMTNGSNGAGGSGSGQGVEVVDGSMNSGVNSDNMLDNSPTAVMKRIEEQAKVIYFDFDKFNIRDDMQPNVETDANLFNSDEAKGYSIKIEGNCDEWGTDEYNYALGLKRAKSVKEELKVLGVEESRMMVLSYGESNPVCTEKTKECWDRNRRVEFKVLP